MKLHTCPGLPGDWLNAWLAALGTLVRCPEIRLSWSDNPIPVALFTTDSDPAEMIASALPHEGELQAMAIARESSAVAGQRLGRKVTFDAYAERAAFAREHDDSTLAASVTDLIEDDEAAHSPFDPPVPQGLTLHDRLARCAHVLTDNAAERVRSTLAGTADRVGGNGLGFDYRRLPAAAEGGELRIDPVIEVLAFYGVTLFPARGDGRRMHARGWSRQATRRGAFTWPLWSDPMDRWAVDALLDRWYADPKDAYRYGVVAYYRSVPYQPQGSADTRRAYSSERLG
jgi:hypothetical protein